MRRLFLVILLFIGVVACDDSYKSSIPDVSRFEFTCDLLQGEYSRLKIPGQFIKKMKNIYGIPVGYAGLIIGKSVFSQESSSEYVAFDAACPVEASRGVSIDVQEDDGRGTAICPECKTKYDLSNSGVPIEGEGKEYLKRYNAIVSGTKLLVHN